MGWGREAGVPGSPPVQRREPELPRACEAGQGVCVWGGRRCLCPAPPPRVSDCPGSGSSAASPPPQNVSRFYPT